MTSTIHLFNRHTLVMNIIIDIFTEKIIIRCGWWRPLNFFRRTFFFIGKIHWNMINFKIICNYSWNFDLIISRLSLHDFIFRLGSVSICMDKLCDCLTVNTKDKLLIIYFSAILSNLMQSQNKSIVGTRATSANIIYIPTHESRFYNSNSPQRAHTHKYCCRKWSQTWSQTWSKWWQPDIIVTCCAQSFPKVTHNNPQIEENQTSCNQK